MKRQSLVFVALFLSLVAGILASEVLSHHNHGQPDRDAPVQSGPAIPESPHLSHSQISH